MTYRNSWNRTEKKQKNPRSVWNRRASVGLGVALAFASGLVLGACDSLLDVELPGQVTEEALFEPGQATILVNSMVSLFECGLSDFVANDAAGYEDVMTRDTGWWGGDHEFQPEPDGAECNTQDTSAGWWSPLQAARFMGDETYRRISEEWSVEEIQGDPDKLMAELALYMGAVTGLFGEHFCDMAFEGGPLMGPDQVMTRSEQWLTDALGHAQDAGGDFALPGGSSSSVEQAALLFRARARWALGDEAGAVADAQKIDQGFKAFVTREASGERTRWNKVFNSHNQEQINTVIGAIDHWEGPPNPATGEPWPAVIPHTGYRGLAILSDGRAAKEGGQAVTIMEFPDAVIDTRTPVTDEGRVFNEHPAWRQQKYPGLDADVPMANWEEAWIIRAKAAGGQEAVDLINEIRAFHGLPLVTYVDPSDAEQVRTMILEDERRSLFLEGRWWSTKIQNVDKLWFPRGVGSVPPPTTFGYLGGVRMVLPENEYELNENFGLSDRATMCDPLEAPLI